MDYELREGSTWEDSKYLGKVDLLRPNTGNIIPWDGKDLRIISVLEPHLLGNGPKNSVLVMDTNRFIDSEAQP